MTEEQYQIDAKKKAVELLRENRDRKEVRPIEELEDEEFKRVVVGRKEHQETCTRRKPDDVEDRVSHKKRAMMKAMSTIGGAERQRGMTLKWATRGTISRIILTIIAMRHTSLKAKRNKSRKRINP
jgi:hypothetical protein